jgi:hypothetical protein
VYAGVGGRGFARAQRYTAETGGRSMANRTKSDPTPQHETMPGPGPSRLGDDGGSGVHPVEQMVDAAIDRLAREHQASRNNQQRHGLVLRNQNAHGSGRLRWKGLDVSDEFRRYAERVAQGEDLPPYEGQILAEPHPKFPWEPSERKRASRRAVGVQMVLWGGAAMVVGLLSWSLATKLGDTTAAIPPAPNLQAPATDTATGATARGVAATSEAVLSIRGAPGEVAQAPELGTETQEPVTEVPSALEKEIGATAVAHPRPSEAPPVAPAITPSSARPAPRSPQSASARELEPIPYPDVAPPGAIREALGALLAARAEPGEFPKATSTEDRAPTPVESRPAPSPAASSSAPPVARKETERQSSASESLLVETPSF